MCKSLPVMVVNKRQIILGVNTCPKNANLHRIHVLLVTINDLYTFVCVTLQFSFLLFQPH